MDRIEKVITIIDRFWGTWGWLEGSKKAEVASQICQLFAKTKDNPDGYEPPKLDK